MRLRTLFAPFQDLVMVPPPPPLLAPRSGHQVAFEVAGGQYVYSTPMKMPMMVTPRMPMMMNNKTANTGNGTSTTSANDGGEEP